MSTCCGHGHVLLSQHADGSIEVLEADNEIHVADEFLECPGYLSEWLHVGDGIMTIHATNGDVSYGLHSYDVQRKWWRGTRSGA